MADILPTDLFSGYTSDGTDITIPIASLPALTTGEANATTGDGREVLRAIIVQAKTALDALATADKPTKLTLTSSNPTGVSASTIRQSYTMTFDLAVSPVAIGMASE
jgi:hypothetical protein